jgi:excisionase family DNA binding protein
VTHQTPVWLSTKDAAARLDVSLRDLYRLIDAGKVPAYKIGRVIRLQQHEVDAAADALWLDADLDDGQSPKA